MDTLKSCPGPKPNYFGMILQTTYIYTCLASYSLDRASLQALRSRARTNNRARPSKSTAPRYHGPRAFVSPNQKLDVQRYNVTHGRAAQTNGLVYGCRPVAGARTFCRAGPPGTAARTPAGRCVLSFKHVRVRINYSRLVLLYRSMSNCRTVSRWLEPVACVGMHARESLQVGPRRRRLGRPTKILGCCC